MFVLCFFFLSLLQVQALGVKVSIEAVGGKDYIKWEGRRENQAASDFKQNIADLFLKFPLGHGFCVTGFQVVGVVSR